MRRVLCAFLALTAGVLGAAEQSRLGAGFAAAGRRDVGWNTTGPFQIAPLVIRGEGWTEQLVIQNVDRNYDTNLYIAFFRYDGTPWTVTLRMRGINMWGGSEDLLTDSVFTLYLPKLGGQAVLELPTSFGAQELGMAYIFQDPDKQPQGEFFGQAIFRREEPGQPDLMTTMPFSALAEEYISVFFDNEGWKYPGVGVVALDAADIFRTRDIQVKMAIRTQDGAVNKIVTRRVRNMGLIWFSLVHEFPETINRLGRIDIWTDEPTVLLSSMSLQFAPNRAFTAICPFEK